MGTYQSSTEHVLIPNLFGEAVLDLSIYLKYESSQSKYIFECGITEEVEQENGILGGRKALL